MNDTLVAFFLADAVGHGVPAALLTMAITRSLQPRNFDHFDPCTALKKLNDELSRHPSGTHRFATAICGTLDLATSKLTIAGAGHPYPLLIEPSGVRLLETEGPMLGVFEDAEFTEVSVTLTPEQTLLIHSDGLEASLEAHQMNVPTLARAFAEDPDVSVHRCMEQLETLLDGGVGSLHQQDDVTLLALRRAPIAAPLKLVA
jgi:sigma-B regulation protein RsbU (phosphoserine phosphatase)